MMIMITMMMSSVREIHQRYSTAVVAHPSFGKLLIQVSNCVQCKAKKVN